MRRRPEPQPGQVWRRGDEWREVFSTGNGRVFYNTFRTGRGLMMRDEWREWSAGAKLIAGPGSETESEAGK